jgi:hypothetical protein
VAHNRLGAKAKKNSVSREGNTSDASLNLVFSNFYSMFLNPNIFFQFEFLFSNLKDQRNLEEQVKKTFCYQKLF